MFTFALSELNAKMIIKIIIIFDMRKIIKKGEKVNSNRNLHVTKKYVKLQ